MARSFRFVTTFADSIVFNYLAVSAYQANGYTLTLLYQSYLSSLLVHNTVQIKGTFESVEF